MTGILELFASLDGSDRYEMQLELWAWERRAAKRESSAVYYRKNKQACLARNKTWRAANPAAPRIGRVQSVVGYETRKQIRARRRALGQCIQCGVDAGGKQLCAKHGAEQNARRRGDAQKAKAA